MFLLDSGHISLLQRGQGEEYDSLVARVRLWSKASFYWPIVSFHEQANGWHAYIQQAKQPGGVVRGYEMFAQLLRSFAAQQILPFDQQASNVFESLKSSGTRVATMDLRIASIALVHEFTLLTRNTVDFARIPGLKFEDWTRP